MHPRNFVQIKEGVPYNVPAGKVLAISGIGSDLEGDYYVSLIIDGTIELSATVSVATNIAFDTSSVRPVTPGLAATAGQVVQIGGGHPNFNDDARAWGYLADA